MKPDLLDRLIDRISRPWVYRYLFNEAIQSFCSSQIYELLRDHIESRYGIPIYEDATFEESSFMKNIGALCSSAAAGTYFFSTTNPEKKIVVGERFYLADQVIALNHEAFNDRLSSLKPFTLAHELGHHIGRVLHNDLSERTATLIGNRIILNVIPKKYLYPFLALLTTENNNSDENNTYIEFLLIDRPKKDILKDYVCVREEMEQ